MSYETVIWEQSGSVGRLTLNRPETLNAWTAEFGRELRQVIERTRRTTPSGRWS